MSWFVWIVVYLDGDTLWITICNNLKGAARPNLGICSEVDKS